MRNEHQIYLISDSTGETLDRIFLALKAQFTNFEYELNNFSFTRTENQIQQILEKAKKRENPIILYTIVNSKLAKYLADQAQSKQIPCFGVFRAMFITLLIAPLSAGVFLFTNKLGIASLIKIS